MGLQLTQPAALLLQRALHRLALRLGLVKELLCGVAFLLKGLEELCGVANGPLANLLGKAGGLLTRGLQRRILQPTRLNRHVEGCT